MALSIKSREADQLARELAALTGKPITEAVMAALQAQLEREKRKQLNKEQLIEDVMAIARHCASLPVLDDRSEDEIMGWDENGLPT
jgi:antitoxin VapB